MERGTLTVLVLADELHTATSLTEIFVSRGLNAEPAIDERRAAYFLRHHQVQILLTVPDNHVDFLKEIKRNFPDVGILAYTKPSFNRDLLSSITADIIPMPSTVPQIVKAVMGMLIRPSDVQKN